MLVLACGNTLRGDDGVAWHIGAALKDDAVFAEIEVVLTQQLLPEHAEPLSKADVAVFIDCSAIIEPCVLSVFSVSPAESLPHAFTHHLDPASLLKLTKDLYGSIPSRNVAVTVGGESFELNEELTEHVAAAIPIAVAVVRRAVFDPEYALVNY
jgi:hydrogenase maturation protease